MPHLALIRLVKSLSKSEKRQFRLSTRKQTGQKEYLDLFDLIDQNDLDKIAIIEEKFAQLHPRSSLDNAGRYLEKVLVDSLIQSKIKEDNLFKLFHGLMRVSVLEERNLPDESFKELKKVQQLALDSQNHFIQSITYRFELNYLADNNFTGLTEKALVERQMKARDTLKTIRDTHELYSLYELLKYRLTHSGKVLSEEGRRQLNDLLLSEIGLVTGRIKNNFESGKLHLLFQSFFFTDIGDYKSALKTFYELNRLFEQNTAIWTHPPLDYLFSLDGILDSLRTIGYYKEMPFYIDKMSQLIDPDYPEYFRFMVEKSVVIYQLTILTAGKEYKKAQKYIQQTNPQLLTMHTLVHYERQWELLFYFALSYQGAKDLNKAQKYINDIIRVGKINYQSIIYKAAMLLNIVIHYEQGNLDYLDYEIRSYKRSFQLKGKLMKTEKLIFKVVKLNPSRNNPRKNKLLWPKIKPAVATIEKDKYEAQLSKYYDFIGWVGSLFTSESR